jgi:hypothetical protein
MALGNRQLPGEDVVDAHVVAEHGVRPEGDVIDADEVHRVLEMLHGCRSTSSQRSR